jgi:hypothetical protein
MVQPTLKVNYVDLVLPSKDELNANSNKPIQQLQDCPHDRHYEVEILLFFVVSVALMTMTFPTMTIGESTSSHGPDP